MKDRNEDGKVDDDEADWGNTHGLDGTVELLTLPEAMEKMTAEKIKDNPVLDYLVQKHIFGFDESDRKAGEDDSGKKDKEMTRDDFIGDAYGLGGWKAALILRDPEQALARIRGFGLKSLSILTDLKTKERAEAWRRPAESSTAPLPPPTARSRSTGRGIGSSWISPARGKNAMKIHLKVARFITAACLSYFLLCRFSGRTSPDP